MSNLEIIEKKEMERPSFDSVASACSEIVKKTAVTIQRKKYVTVEGWQSIAVAHGMFAGCDSVKREVDQNGNVIGWEATAYIKNKNGVTISSGVGFVGKDERSWGKRDEYACRAMAQTRAISRACRSTFAHIVVMIDNDLSTTPAEEIPQSPPQNEVKVSLKDRFSQLVASDKKHGIDTTQEESLLNGNANDEAIKTAGIELKNKMQGK
jgi:hypothetical protein